MDDFWWKGVQGAIYAKHFYMTAQYVNNLKHEPRNPYPNRRTGHVRGEYTYTDYASVPCTDDECVMWFEHLTGVMGVGDCSGIDPILVERYIEAIICHETFHGEIMTALDEEWSEKFDHLHNYMDIPPDGEQYLQYRLQCRFSYPDWQAL